MTFTVYMLYSAEKDRFYIGQTKDINERTLQHNIRKNLGGSERVLKYSETFNTRSEATQ
jgi:predicted GIY-YIG superfamily endonuclease